MIKYTGYGFLIVLYTFSGRGKSPDNIICKTGAYELYRV